MNQAFSKIWIVVILIILIVGGIFAWQYFKVAKEGEIPEEKVEEKIVEKKVKVAAAEEPTEITVKVREKEGEWNTIIMDEYLGYEIDYPKDWEIFAEVGLGRGFTKTFKKGQEEIACSIEIYPIARKVDLWEKSCAETQTDYYSRYWSNWEVNTATVNIGNTPSLKITNSALPGNIMYSFGPNPIVLGKWCYEISLNTEKLGKYDPETKTWITLGKRGIVMPECEEVLNHAISTFKFIEPSKKPSISEIQTGKEDKYKTVELKDVINYYDPSKVKYVRTEGIIVGLKYDDYGGSILLSDNNSHYLLVTISHAAIDNYKTILVGLQQGDKIEVEGIPSFTSPKVADLKGKFNLQQELPETIGMLELDPFDGIKKTE